MTTKKTTTVTKAITSKASDNQERKHGSCFSCGRVTDVKLTPTGTKDMKVPVKIWLCNRCPQVPAYLLQK